MTFFRRNHHRLQAIQAHQERLQAEHERMQSVLEAFQAACSAAGVGCTSAEPDSLKVPPALLLACRAPRPGGEPVVLTRHGRKVIAVVGPGGDPDEWMPAIRAVPSPAGRRVTRIERAELPDGLLAVAAVPASGGLTVRVSDLLTHRETRDAIATAVRAARRTGWRDYSAGAASAVALIVLLSLKVAPVKLALSSGAVLGGTVAAALVMIPVVAVPYSTHSVPPPPAATVVHHGRRRPGLQPSPSRPGTGTTPATGQLASSASPAQTGTQAPAPAVSASVSTPAAGVTVASTPGTSTSVGVTLPVPAPSVTECVTLPLLGNVCLAA